jgi:hypothetical protein
VLAAQKALAPLNLSLVHQNLRYFVVVKPRQMLVRTELQMHSKDINDAIGDNPHRPHHGRHAGPGHRLPEGAEHIQPSREGRIIMINSIELKKLNLFKPNQKKSPPTS